MRRFSPLGILFILPVFLFLTAVTGCPKKPVPKEDEDGVVETGPSSTKTGTATTGKGKQPIKAGDGVITGRVVFGGTPPEPMPIEAMVMHKDKDICLAAPEAQKVDQKWMIDKSTKGVANAVIYLKAPPGKYFEPSDADKKRTDVVALDQPFCAFVPHVLSVFPSYYDGKKQQPTGQKFVIKNSASVPHNSAVQGDPVKNPQISQTINPGDQIAIDLKAQTDPIHVSCQFHPWMKATIIAFDHPYVAVTKEDGTFEIRNVPTGMELQIVGWHEAKPNFYDEKKTFNSGFNNLGDITLTP